MAKNPKSEFFPFPSRRSSTPYDTPHGAPALLMTLLMALRRSLRLRFTLKTERQTFLLLAKEEHDDDKKRKISHSSFSSPRSKLFLTWVLIPFACVMLDSLLVSPRSCLISNESFTVGNQDSVDIQTNKILV